MSGLSILHAIAGAAFLGAVLAWIAAARAFVGVWNARGGVSRLELAGSFLTAARKLPPAGVAQLKRLIAAGSIFFALILVGLTTGFLALR